MRRFRLLLALLALLLLPAATAHAADCATAPSWSGTGTTRTVPSGGSVQSAIDSSSAGDTVVVANGSYSSFSLTKNVRVMAQSRYGATVSGTVRTTSGWLDGFVINSGSNAINADGTGDLVVANNRLVLGGSGQSFRAFRTTNQGKIIIWGNDFEGQADYAIQLYGTTNAESCHNYFFGSWHQTNSFKEGNTGGTFAYNTLTGGCCAGVEIGQNGDDNGVGGIDHGTFHIHHNWLGMMRSSSGVLSLGGPIRIWHVTRANITIDNNVIVGGQSGVEIDCASGSITDSSDVQGCADGTITLRNNVVAGRVQDPATGSVSTPTLGCLLQGYNSGTGGSLGSLTITSDGLHCWDTPLLYAWRLPTPSFTNNDTTSGHTQTFPSGPSPRFNPDLSLLGVAPPPGDTTAPSAISNLKRNDAKTEGDPGRIWFTWDPATDNVGVDHYREYRDGSLVDSAVSPSLANPGPGDYVGDGSLATCSDHTVGVEAVDAAGNVGPRNTVTMKTGGCAPPSPPPPSGLPAPTGFVNYYSDQTGMWLTWNAVTGAARYTLTMDGAPAGSTTDTGTYFHIAGLACGTSHALTVKAVDSSGVAGAAASTTGTVAPC